MTERWTNARLAHRDHQAASIASSALSLITERGAPALTMAAIAKHADVSRQTLYRYFRDIDAVLVAIAELVASHDEELERLVGEQPNPTSQLDLIAHTITPTTPTTAGTGTHAGTTSARHSTHSSKALAAVLPPAGRDVLTKHETNVVQLMSDVLRRGVDDGSFHRDLDPDGDAPLILGLLTATESNRPERALTLVHRLVDHPDKGATT